MVLDIRKIETMNKPKILKEKIILAGLIRIRCTELQYFRQEKGYYWHGIYIVGTRKLYIYFQRYVRKQAVHYVKLTWMDTQKAMTPTEIRNIFKTI